MNSYFKTLKNFLTQTLSGLTGIDFDISYLHIVYPNKVINNDLLTVLKEKHICTSFKINDKINYMLCTNDFYIILTDLMLGGDGNNTVDYSREEKEDVAIEFTDNILSNFTYNNYENYILEKSYKIVDENEMKDIENIEDFIIVEYYFTFNNVKHTLKFLLDEKIVIELKKNNNIKSKKLVEHAIKNDSEIEPSTHLLEDVEIELKVLLGSTEITLKELIDKINKKNQIILNSLANDSVILIANNVKIAEGEVVIVDGDFGIQISKIFEKGIQC